MINKYLAYLCAFVMCTACGTSEKHHDHDHDHEGHNHEIEEHHHEADEHEHEHEHSTDEIVFEHSKAEKMGVKSILISPTPFNSIIKVSGEIISAQGDSYVVSAPSAGIVRFSKNITAGSKVNAGAIICSISGDKLVGGDSNSAARITYEAAKREFERIESLFKDKIVTEREYNTAREAFEKAKIAYLGSSASGSKASTAISGVVTEINVTDGAFVEAGTAIATVCKNVRLQLHADVPQQYLNQVANIVSANFTTPYNDNVIRLSELNGKRVSAASTTATQGYIPVVFEFDNDNTLAAGTYAEIYLISSAKHDAIIVPAKALTEELNKFFVFIQIDEDCYEKRLVTIGQTDGENVEIVSGITGGEKVVTEGAVFVKLASNSGAIPEGHSHNH